MPVQCFLSACKTCHAPNPITDYWCTFLQSYVIEFHAFQVLHANLKHFTGIKCSNKKQDKFQVTNFRICRDDIHNDWHKNHVVKTY